MEILPLSLTQTTELKLNHRTTTTSPSDKRIERRKPNWTECENVFLLDQFSIHREILTCKATDASTNLRKQEVWRIICSNLNKQNVQVRRTPAEVRRKWKNLVTAAKKEVWEIRHQAHVTGASRKLSELSQRVLQLHSSSASAIALFMSGTREGLGGLGIGIGNNNNEESTTRCYNINNNNNSSNNNNNSSSPIPQDFDKNLNGYYSGSNGGLSSSHFTPIVQFSESISSPNGSMDVSSNESRNEFDSGIYEQAHDLRVNKNSMSLSIIKNMKVERNISETTEEEEEEGIIKPNDDLIRAKLELQIDVFRLQKRKLEIEIRRLRRSPAYIWKKKPNKLFK